MEYLKSICLPFDLQRAQKMLFDLEAEIAKVNRQVTETNGISETVVGQLDSLEEKLRKYLSTEQILELEEKRTQQRRDFELLQFISLQPEVWVSELEFARDAGELEKTLQLKGMLVNLFWLCFREIQRTLEQVAVPELEIMDAWYEAVSLFRAYKRNPNINFEKITFFYDPHKTQFEPFIEKTKHARHITHLYHLLLIGRDLASSPLITKHTVRITKDDCREVKKVYAEIVKQSREVSLLRTLGYEEVKKKRDTGNVRIFKEIYECDV